MSFAWNKGGDSTGGACVSVVYRCVNKKKTMRKGTIFRPGQCAVLSSFRVGKCYFCRKRVCF